MIRFTLTEGWRNFKNLGIVGLLTLMSLTVTLTLSGLSIRGYQLMNEWSEGLLGRFEIEAFLDERVDSLQVSNVASEINKLYHVGQVDIITKSEAAKRFSDQFGHDLLQLLDYNPLPMSLIVSLEKGSDPLSSWDSVASIVSKIDGVIDVAYQGELLAQMTRFYRRGGLTILVSIGITVILSLTFTILTVYSAIRSRYDFIYIVLTCGGSNAMARSPFIALGLYYGMISGVLASGLVFGILELVHLGWGITTTIPSWWILMLVGGGVLIGVMGAGWASGHRIKST